MKLYQLSQQYTAIEGMLENEYITREEIDTSLADIKDQIEDKVESIGKMILSLSANIEAILVEEERLAKRRHAMQNLIEWLKGYLLAEMTQVNIDKVKRELVTVSVGTNPPSVEVVQLDEIPQEYRRVIPETWQPDKKAILEHFKSTGDIVWGCDVITNKKHITVR